MGESHIITKAIVPMVAITRAGCTLLQGNGKHGPALPLALGNDIRALAQLIIGGDRLDNLLICNGLTGLDMDSAAFRKDGIVRLEAHTVDCSTFSLDCKHNI